MKPAWMLFILTGFAGCSSDVVKQASDLFAPRADLPVGAEPKAVVIDDMDGDGRNDIAVARATPNGSVTFLMGRSDGNFGRINATDMAGDTPFSLAVADFDKDGNLDVAVGNYFGAEVAAIFSRDFQTRVAMPAEGAHPFSLVAADIDGNGQIDLVSSVDVGDALNVMLNQGNRTFAPATNVAINGTPGGLVVGDLDGDGPSRLDVAVAIPNSNLVRLLHGGGTGALTAVGATDLSMGLNPVGLAAAHIDDDTTLDLVSTNAGDDTVSVLLRSGSSFAAATGYPVGKQPSALAIGDIDGDGFLDIVTSNRGSQTITVLRGLSSGRFSVAGDLAVGTQPEGIAVGDVNGDGIADVAVVNLGDDTVSLFLSRRQSGT